MSNQEKIQEMVRRIKVRFDPDKIILFGSHARGDAGPDSDVDLLIVMPAAGSKRKKQVEVRMVLHDIRAVKDIVIVTPDEFEQHQHVAGTIVRPAVKEGQVLYARS